MQTKKNQERKLWQYIKKDQFYWKNVTSKTDHVLYFQLKVKILHWTAFSIWKNNAVLSASLWIWFHPPIWFNDRKLLLRYLTVLKTLPGGTLSTASQKQLTFKDGN